MSLLMFDTQATLAALATRLPAASRIFQRYRLDFCFAGGLSLEEACSQHGLDPTRVLHEIEAASKTRLSYEAWTAQDLIEHILARYHAPLRLELDRLVHLAESVERANKENPSCPHGLTEHLVDFREELLAHLAEEEQTLFPALIEGAGLSARGPIWAVTMELESQADNLTRTRDLTNDLVPPKGASDAWRSLYLALSDLERELMEHIHLENNVLFPRLMRI
jgi:regulator of cell morphogenesis and NO signaling